MGALRSLRRATIKGRHGVKGLRLLYDLEREKRGEEMHFFHRRPPAEDPAGTAVSEPKGAVR